MNGPTKVEDRSVREAIVEICAHLKLCSFHPHPSHRKLFNLNPPLNPTPLGGHGHLLKMQKGRVHTQGVYSTQKLSPIENHKLDKIKFNTRPEQDHSI